MLNRRDFLLSSFATAVPEEQKRNLPYASPEAQRDSIKFAQEQVNPILGRHALDPKEFGSISSRLRRLSEMSSQNKLKYEAVAGLNPFDPSSVAKVDFDSEQNKIRLLLFIPKIQKDKTDFEWSGKSKNFEEYIVLTVVHEMIHVELLESNPEYLRQLKLGWVDRNQMLKNEAEAWGKTIIEVVRPMLTVKRFVPQVMVEASALLKTYGDNISDSRWIQGFSNYHKEHK